MIFRSSESMEQFRASQFINNRPRACQIAGKLLRPLDWESDNFGAPPLLIGMYGKGSVHGLFLTDAAFMLRLHPKPADADKVDSIGRIARMAHRPRSTPRSRSKWG
jgi:hypothetical protein